MATKQEVHAKLDELEALYVEKIGELDIGIDEYFDQVQRAKKQIAKVRQIVHEVGEDK